VPDHPDQEQLAAYQAGDVDRRERLDVEAHLAGCPSCAELVASVGQARGSLALLEEPDLPPGLHDRIAAAVQAEVAATAEARAGASRPAVGRAGSRQQRGGSRNGSGSRRSGGPDREPPVPRPLPWYRRPVAWGAAAALILAALVVPYLTQSGGVRTTAGGDSAGGGAAQEAATQGQVAAGSLPVFRVQGEVTAASVRDRLAADPRARAALSRPASPDSADRDQGGLRTGDPAPQAGTAEDQASPSERQPCVSAASADADPATRPLVPGFFIEGTYKGRDATILVTTSTPQPSRVDLWVFPRDNCAAPPLATERVR
jgi:hypothetical protein